MNNEKTDYIQPDDIDCLGMVCPSCGLDMEVPDCVFCGYIVGDELPGKVAEQPAPAPAPEKPRRKRKINANSKPSGASIHGDNTEPKADPPIYYDVDIFEALTNPADPLHDTDDHIEWLSFDDLDTPCFLVRDDWFELLDSKRKPGVWWCYQTEGTEKKPPTQHAIFICSPLYIEGITNTEDGRFFGRLLRFRDSLGHWRQWAMPMELLRGSCEELRGELLAAGVEIDTRNRAKLSDYLQWRVPREVWTAATRTGWTANGGAYVFQDRVIGDERVHYQSENISTDGAARIGGSYQRWQAMAGYCEGNPVLMTSLSVALSGPLLAKTHKDSGGVHWVGDSSTGKTTALVVGASVWGGDDFTVERPLRDENGNILLGEKGKLKGKPQPDSSLRDSENVPLSEDVESYFKREVLPHAPDAWIDHDKTKVGYEIPFNRHFYVFEPPRDLAAIDADLKQCTDRILAMIAGLSA